MAWVKLKKKNGDEFYLNMDRFDKVEAVIDNDHDEVTRISSILSENDDDINIDVVDRVESFMDMLIAHGK